MDNNKKEQRLVLALKYTDYLINLVDDFDYSKHLLDSLHPLKFELNRQLHNHRFLNTHTDIDDMQSTLDFDT